MPDEPIIRPILLPNHSATSDTPTYPSSCRLPATGRAGECHECSFCGARKTCPYKTMVRTGESDA